MKFIPTLLAIAAIVINVSASLPAHAEASLSAVDTAIEATIDPAATQTTEPEDIDPEVSDFPDKIENATVTLMEEIIISRNTSPVANESCFGVDPVTPTFPPVFGNPDKTLPSDEDPAANEIGSMSTEELDKLQASEGGYWQTAVSKWCNELVGAAEGSRMLQSPGNWQIEDSGVIKCYRKYTEYFL
jgi:hypothetical protein